MDHQTRVLPIVRTSVGGHCVLLVVHRSPDDDQRVLDYGVRIAEDEVHGARDHAVPVELTVRLNVQGVLVPVHSAVEERGLVGLDS